MTQLKEFNDNHRKEVLFGTLLGDSSLQTYTGGNTWRACFLQADKNQLYLFHLYDVFKPWVKTPPKFHETSEGYKRWYFNTTVQTVCNDLAPFFYKKNKKIVPNLTILNEYLTPRAIAYWFMDDGSLKSNCLAYILCTDSFSLLECKLLAQVFFDKFGIRTSFHKQRKNYRIYIPRSEYSKFRNLVKPYIIPSMFYKLG